MKLTVSQNGRPILILLVLMYIILVFRGSEFRTAFSNIGGLRALTGVPFMALSASAPPLVAKAITESLHLKSPVSISLGLDRPNIFFSFAKSKGLAVSMVHNCAEF